MATTSPATLRDYLATEGVPYGYITMRECFDSGSKWKPARIKWVGTGKVYRQNCDWSALPDSTREPETAVYVPRPEAPTPGKTVIEKQHYLAYSTAKFFVLDIDDLPVFQDVYPDLAAMLSAGCPHYLSRNKRYPHYLVKVQNFPKGRYSAKTGNLKHLHKLMSGAGELLTGQGTWVRPDDATARLVNGDRSPMTINFADLVPSKKKEKKEKKERKTKSKKLKLKKQEEEEEEEEEEKDAQPPPPPNAMQDLLALIDPVRFIAPREPWLKIGTALRSAYGSKVGFELYDKLSARAPEKYDGTEETRRQFAGMSVSAGVGVGTLVHYARESNPAATKEWLGVRAAARRGDKIGEVCRKCGVERSIVEYACEDKCARLKDNDIGLADIYVRLCGDKIKMVDGGGSGDSYLWDPVKRLWVFWRAPFVKVKIQEAIRRVVFAAIEVGLGKGGGLTKTIAASIRGLCTTTRYASGIMAQVMNRCYTPDFEDGVDRSPDELPIRGGLLLNLRTGEVRPRTCADLWSFELPVSHQDVGASAGADAERLLNSVCNEPQGGPLTEYLKQVLGYSMTGCTTERHYYIFHGHGRNGKSTIIEAFLNMLGPLGTALSDAALLDMGGRSGSATPELMPLRKARVGILSETVRGAKLDPKRVKELTGNDKISGRALYKEQVTFKPQAKYLHITNFRPEYDARDQAMNDRIRLVPFDARFEATTANNEFVSRFREVERLDALFALLVRGARAYYDAGCVCAPPQRAKQATDEYRTELDVFGTWLDTCRRGDDEVTGKPLRWKKTDCFADFKEYARVEGAETARDCPQLNRRMFYECLGKTGFEVKKIKGTRFVMCLARRVESEDGAGVESEDYPDLFGTWLATCEHGKPLRWKRADCYAAFEDYARAKGAEWVSNQVFYKCLGAAGFELRKIRGTRYVMGLAQSVKIEEMVLGA